MSAAPSLQYAEALRPLRAAVLPVPKHLKRDLEMGAHALSIAWASALGPGTTEDDADYFALVAGNLGQRLQSAPNARAVFFEQLREATAPVAPRRVAPVSVPAAPVYGPTQYCDHLFPLSQCRGARCAE